jgi:hypothetical protein
MLLSGSTWATPGYVLSTVASAGVIVAVIVSMIVVVETTVAPAAWSWERTGAWAAQAPPAVVGPQGALRTMIMVSGRPPPPAPGGWALAIGWANNTAPVSTATPAATEDLRTGQRINDLLESNAFLGPDTHGAQN